MPIGLRLEGVPPRAGLRAGDVVVDCGDAVLFDFHPFDIRRRVVVSLDVGRGVFVALGTEVAADAALAVGARVPFVEGVVEVVDADLCAGARVVGGFRVVGPRGVGIRSTMTGRTITTRWDVVGADESIVVVDADGAGVEVQRLRWQPGGLSWRGTAPAIGFDDEDGPAHFAPNARWGTLRPGVVKRFVRDAGARTLDAHLGWDGKVHVTADADVNAHFDAARAWHHHAFAAQLASEDALEAAADAEVAAAYAACDVAADAEIAGLVAGLRPDLVTSQRQYREELALLSARPR